MRDRYICVLSFVLGVAFLVLMNSRINSMTWWRFSIVYTTWVIQPARANAR